MATPAAAPAPPNPNPVPDDPPLQQQHEEEEEESPEPEPETAPTSLTTSIDPTPSGGEESESDDSSSVSSAPSSAPAPAPAAAAAATPSPAAKDLLHISFNQDYGCFAAGTKSGFRIYNCDPFREIFRRDLAAVGDGATGAGVGGGAGGGGIGVVEMLFRCNILALVGGGDNPHYPPNKVMIWDDHQSRCIGELSFRSPVRGVRLRRDRIIVVLENKIFVYNFADLKLVHQIETAPNPKGLCAVSQQPGSIVLVCPGAQKGQIRVEHYGARKTKFINAHTSRVACFALSQDGRLIATASTKGTLVRIYNAAEGNLLQEVRRGADRRAVVVNLDRVRAVITATEVLVPGPRDPSVAPLVAELRTRLAAASPAPPRAVSDGEVGKDGGVSPPSGGGGGKALPFEFRALEVCLEYACKSLEHETSMLEKEAYPALDALTSRISTLNLEHVRQIKCRLVAIAGGVHKVRDELEHLLDDDADMAAMHLSEKAAFQAASQSSRFDIGTELVEIDGEGDEDEAGTEQEEQGSMTFMPKIDELESLLEVYFVQIDGTLNKLSTLREYVDDTEDYINIMLDDKQNQLLQMGVVLSTVTLLVTSAVVVTAIFGMNIHIALYRITDLNVFWEAVGGTLAGVAMLFLGAMLYYWKNGILR